MLIFIGAFNFLTYAVQLQINIWKHPMTKFIVTKGPQNISHKLTKKNNKYAMKL